MLELVTTRDNPMIDPAMHVWGWEVRADPAGQNKGGGAAAAALHLIALSRTWAGKSKGIGFRA